jgi:hypothetical protein
MSSAIQLTTIPTEGFLRGWAVTSSADGFVAFCLCREDAKQLGYDGDEHIRPALLTPDGVVMSTGELATHDQLSAVYKYQRVALIDRKVG